MSKEKQHYMFPPKGAIECPRCRATDTEATSTKGRFQYRACIRPTCRETFHIVGLPVKTKPQKGETKNAGESEIRNPKSETTGAGGESLAASGGQ